MMLTHQPQNRDQLQCRMRPLQKNQIKEFIVINDNLYNLSACLYEHEYNYFGKKAVERRVFHIILPEIGSWHTV